MNPATAIQATGRVLRKAMPASLYRHLARVVGRTGLVAGHTRRYPPRPAPGMLVNDHSCLDEPRFVQALTAAYGPKEAQHGCHDQYKFYTLCWAAEHAMASGADIVQCGVFLGTGAMAMAHYARLDRMLHRTMTLIDTFAGVPEQYRATSVAPHKMYAQEAEHAYRYVAHRFSEYPNVQILKGAIPECLDRVQQKPLGLLSIDLNSAEAETAAVEHFWPQIVDGGLVHADDYGHTAHHAQKKALDAFAHKKGLSVLTLPTGDGLLFKV